MENECPICRVMGSSRAKECVWIGDVNNNGDYMVVPVSVYKKMLLIAEKGRCHININGRLESNRQPYFGGLKK